MGDILTVSGLTRRYTDFTLKDISMKLPGGAIMGVIGENGAGKTTLMKLILGILKPDGGEISILGSRDGMDSREIREQVGVVFDECRFHDCFTAKEVGNIMKNLYSTWDSEYYRKLCTLFFLLDGKKIKDYSKGMKMKISIAAALAHHPRLLMLDEPTSGLDPVARDEILEVFQDFISDEEHSIFFSSHITSDLEKIADYVSFLKKGELCFSLQKETLRDTFTFLQCSKDLAVSDRFRRLTVGMRERQFGCELLLKCSVREARRLLAESGEASAVAETAGLENIMLLYQGGQQ